MKNQITFEILSEEEFDAKHFDGEALAPLGGSMDSGEEKGLGIWHYQFEVLIKNKDGEQQFTVAFQPEERSNSIKAYSGYELAPASSYGDSGDEYFQAERFCDYDTVALDALQEKAEKAAKEELENLLEDLI